MNIKMLCGTDNEAKAIVDWLVGIYEKDDPRNNPEGFTITVPKSITILYIENVGGIIIDLIGHRHMPEKKRSVCQYLCVEKDFRGQGVARKLVELADKASGMAGAKFVGAYVESSKQMQLWKNLGYPHQGNIGFNIAMLNKPMKKIFD